MVQIPLAGPCLEKVAINACILAGGDAVNW